MSWGNQGWDNSSAWKEKVEKEFKKEFEKTFIQTEPIELELFVPCEVQGKKVGDLMVYGWRGNWYVAHIPTETRFDMAVPEGDWTEEQLINWCHKVQQERKPLWEVFAAHTFETFKDIDDRDKEVLKAHCLSIKVN